MYGPWIPLQLSQNPKDAPGLFIRFDFKSDSYAISVTDFERVWSEVLNRREIIRRALDENTSIDPSEDKSQLELLLESIAAPLKDNAGVVELGPTSKDGLLLRTATKLPAPFHTLTWTFHLSLEPNAATRRQLTAPLSVLLYRKERQIQDLVQLLKDKDHVITRLLDQLEAVNADMATLFPSTAGLKPLRGVSKREQAAHLVPGLGAFKEVEWKSAFSRKHPEVSEGFENTFNFNEETAALFREMTKEGDDNEGKNWWKRLETLSVEPLFPDTDESQVSRISETQLPVKTTQSEEDGSETEDDDESSDFQKQRTTPLPTPVRANEPPVKDVQSIIKPREHVVDTRSGQAISESKHNVRKLGRIGGAATQAQPHSSAITHEPEATNGRAENTPYGLVARPTKKLGRIGATKRGPNDTINDPSAQNSSESPSRTGTKHPRASDGPEKLPLTAPGSTAMAVADQSPNPQSGEMNKEQEIASADKKRNDLKKRLEQQVPAKKKRRF